MQLKLDKWLTIAFNVLFVLKFAPNLRTESEDK